MGKAVTITKPNSPATNRQTYAIYLMTGVDVRGDEKDGLFEAILTKQTASDIIDMIMSGQAYVARIMALEAGGIAKKADVHKGHRSDPKPKGYADKIKALTEEEEPDAYVKELEAKLAQALSAIAELQGKPAEKPKPKAEPKPKKAPTRREVKAKAARAKETPKPKSEYAPDVAAMSDEQMAAFKLLFGKIG